MFGRRKDPRLREPKGDDLDQRPGNGAFSFGDLMRIVLEPTVVPPPTAQRLAKEALLARSFRSWPYRVRRHVVVDISRGRRMHAMTLHRFFSRWGPVETLGGEVMWREVRRALGL